VTHLSKAQLARKRANDREAQRNIRQRTKEHIENLERRVKELEAEKRSDSMERLIQRNRELELEVERLRAQLTQRTSPVDQTSPIQEELLIPQKLALDWIPDTYKQENVLPVSIYPTADQVYPTAQAYTDAEPPEHLYTPTAATPMWDDPTAFVRTTQSLTKPATAWAPFNPALSQPPPRFTEFQPSGFSNVINPPPPPYTNTTCWQSQPSVYEWQVFPKLKTPVTPVDHLIMRAIHSHRNIQFSDPGAEELLGLELPPVQVLFNPHSPAKMHPAINDVMVQYSNVLSARGFTLIPEKLASFICMYRLVQWQISPSPQTYKALYEWQRPRKSQLVITHPAWMDLPPWPKFREKIIENQARYDTPEFQHDYVTNVSANFPYDPMESFVFESNQVLRVSKVMENHLRDPSNFSMKKAFGDKYPEFREVCRIDEI
jgi:regulator of replication initiation timing